MRANMSQRQLAELSGVGRSGIVTFEKGGRNCSMLLGKMLSDGLNVPFSELIAEAERRFAKGKK